MLTGAPTAVIAVAVVVLVAAIEAGAWVRVPLGLVLAITLLAQDLDLAPVVVLGAAGVAAGRLLLALAARRPARRRDAGALVAGDAVGSRIADHPAFARISFTMSMLPGVPGRFLFPLLGRLRAPLGPALAGTVLGRLPILAVTTTVFVALGRVTTGGDDSSAAIMLGCLAVGLLVAGVLRLVDWEHHAAGGGWRMRESQDGAARVTSMFGGAASGSGMFGPGGIGPGGIGTAHAPEGTGPPTGAADQDDDVIEGEILDVEFDADR